MIDQKQLENVEYFSYLGSMTRNSARCTGSLKSRIAIAKVAFNKKQNLCTSKLVLKLRKKLFKNAKHGAQLLYGTETLTLWKADLKYLESWKCGFGEG